MADYICNTCGLTFHEPLRITNRITDVDGIPYDEHDEICPFCSSRNFAEAIPCPVCGKLMPKEHGLCEDCREALKIKFTDFVYDLAPAERKVLDDALDGMSIESEHLFD